MSNSPVSILIVEDDDIDLRVVLRAFEKQKISNPILVARNGQHALSMLRGTDGQTKVDSPVLVLLDLNMPIMGGHEFLSELRKDDELCRTIVFVLTTSDAESDRVAAYDKNIAGYLVKQHAGRDLMNHIPLLHQFLLTVQFPDPHSAGINACGRMPSMEVAVNAT